ncbi:hypothetical protein WJX79_009447 [Trebouxia sp. C0005]
MSAHHRSREQQSGLPGSSNRRSEREDGLRAGSKSHDNRDRRDQGRSIGRDDCRGQEVSSAPTKQSAFTLSTGASAIPTSPEWPWVLHSATT